MGNRAVITTRNRDLGVYFHWNGGRDTIEPLLYYCKLQDYRDPAKDSYGYARLCQVAGNYFGGNTCIGISPYTTDEEMNPGDNGIYIIEDWKIVDRVIRNKEFVEQQEYDFNEMLRSFDARMPESCQLGDFLDSVEIPLSDLQVGDSVWIRRESDEPPVVRTVMEFGPEEPVIYGRRFKVCHPVTSHFGAVSINDDWVRLQGETCRIVPRDEKKD